jgi:hypothetical protein
LPFSPPPDKRAVGLETKMAATNSINTIILFIVLHLITDRREEKPQRQKGGKEIQKIFVLFVSL